MSQESTRLDQSHSEQEHGGQVNVGSQERWISTGAGVALGLLGLRRLGWSGLMGLGLGALLIKRGATGHCELYDKLGVDTLPREGAAPEDYFSRGIHVQETFTINKPAGELYRFWRDFGNLPQFMKHITEVEVHDDERSHWVIQGPANITLEWDAQVINDEPDRLIAWKSLAGADVDNTGSVGFEALGDQRTRVAITIEYIPPAGKVGSLAARLFGRDADQLIRKDLLQFKSLMETGQIEVERP